MYLRCNVFFEKEETISITFGFLRYFLLLVLLSLRQFNCKPTAQLSPTTIAVPNPIFQISRSY